MDECGNILWIYSISCMDSPHGICSQLLWFQHTSGNLLERPILPLRYTILLGSVGDWMLDLNTNLGTYMWYIINDIIPTIIRSQNLDLFSRCILNQGLQFSEFFQDFRLLFDKKDPCVSWKVINESQNVPWSIHGCDRHGTIDIRMYQSQDAWCSVFLPPIELMLRVLANNTTLANSGGSFDAREAFNHGILL